MAAATEMIPIHMRPLEPDSDSDSSMESPYAVEVEIDIAKRVVGRPIEIGDRNIMIQKNFTIPEVTGPCRFPYCGFSSGTLLEVFSVRINKIDNGGRYLYGSFKVQDGLDYWFFKREKPDCVDADGAESLDPDQTGEVQLVEPNTTSIFADHMPCFELTLSNENSSLPSYGCFGWGMLREDLYNVPLAAIFDGEFGSVTVNYALFTQPLGAKVEIVLLDATHSNHINSHDGDGKDCQGQSKRPKLIKTANVYGRISARNSFFESDEDESMLFNRKMKSSLCVNYGENIPLSRSIVSLPYPASLIVKVELWDGDNNSVSPIAKGQVEFMELNKGCTSVSYISGTIQVNVTSGYYISGGKGC